MKMTEQIKTELQELFEKYKCQIQVKGDELKIKYFK